MIYQPQTNPIATYKQYKQRQATLKVLAVILLLATGFLYSHLAQYELKQHATTRSQQLAKVFTPIK